MAAARAARRAVHFSTAWIPGNLLAEGTLIVGAAISTMDPVRMHFYERDAVAFQVMDSMEGIRRAATTPGRLPGRRPAAAALGDAPVTASAETSVIEEVAP